MQHTVNWCPPLWSSLIWISSDSQGWLTVISAPYRPRPDSVAVDGKRRLPWLHSLCVCVSVYPKNGLIHVEGGVCACICECVWMHECVCVLVCFDLTEWHIPEENVTSSGKNRHASWYDQMVKEDEARYREAGESFIDSPKTPFHRTASPQRSDKCVCVCVRRVFEM